MQRETSSRKCQCKESVHDVENLIRSNPIVPYRHVLASYLYASADMNERGDGAPDLFILSYPLVDDVKNRWKLETVVASPQRRYFLPFWLTVKNVYRMGIFHFGDARVMTFQRKGDGFIFAYDMRKKMFAIFFFNIFFPRSQ